MSWILQQIENLKAKLMTNLEMSAGVLRVSVSRSYLIGLRDKNYFCNGKIVDYKDSLHTTVFPLVISFLVMTHSQYLNVIYCRFISTMCTHASVQIKCICKFFIYKKYLYLFSTVYGYVIYAILAEHK